MQAASLGQVAPMLEPPHYPALLHHPASTFPSQPLGLTSPSVWLAVSAAVQEERPLYLFDKHFGEKCPELANDYSIPPYFADDLLYEQRVCDGVCVCVCVSACLCACLVPAPGSMVSCWSSVVLVGPAWPTRCSVTRCPTPDACGHDVPALASECDRWHCIGVVTPVLVCRMVVSCSCHAAVMPRCGGQGPEEGCVRRGARGIEGGASDGERD